MKRLIQTTVAVSATAFVLAAPAFAETEISAYLGYQTLPHSRMTGKLPNGGGSFSELIGWEGKSVSMPPYYGVRGTIWRDDNLGFGLEYTHTKAYAPDSTRRNLGFSRLEFSDGHNVATVNVMKRYPQAWANLTPYVGGGVGIAFPHVDATHISGSRTYGFQLAGPALRLTGGVSMPINDRVSTFAEYQFTYSDLTGKFDEGGTFKTDMKTNAINVGLSWHF